MTGVAKADQHLPFDFRLIRRVVVCIGELLIGQVTPFIALTHLSFIQ